jgi:hypothetical protein
MADSNVPSYPNMFDPSQLSNKFSNVNGMKFPMYNYWGTPTDVMGNPIAGYQAPAAPAAPAATTGTSINSLPAVGSPARAMSNAGYGDWSQLDPTLGISSRSGQTGSSFSSLPGQAGQATAATAAKQQAPQGNFNYLTALANPGKINTPGVTPPPRASQPGGFDMDALLSKLQAGSMTPPTQAQTGLIGGTAPSSGFLQTLAALRGSSPGAAAPTAQAQSASGPTSMSSLFPNPPAGTPGAPKDFATRGYLDENGRPTAALSALMQPWAAAQSTLARGGK